ncbi:MAG: CRISPR-associated endonuclease Cas2 [Chloroflexota bacterium]
MKLFLIYDIQEDKARGKVAELCKNYGLRRVQYSTFFGDLSRNRQEELILRIRRLVDPAEAYVLLLPTCERDLAMVLEAGAPMTALIPRAAGR